MATEITPTMKQSVYVLGKLFGYATQAIGVKKMGSRHLIYQNRPRAGLVIAHQMVLANKAMDPWLSQRWRDMLEHVPLTDLEAMPEIVTNELAGSWAMGYADGMRTYVTAGGKEYLVDLRKKAGLTQQQLADIIDEPRNSISRWEAGVSKPRQEALSKLAEALGCDPDHIALK